MSVGAILRNHGLCLVSEYLFGFVRLPYTWNKLLRGNWRSMSLRDTGRSLNCGGSAWHVCEKQKLHSRPSPISTGERHSLVSIWSSREGHSGAPRDATLLAGCGPRAPLQAAVERVCLLPGARGAPDTNSREFKVQEVTWQPDVGQCVKDCGL